MGKARLFAAIAIAILLVQSAGAHKPVTSKYTFTEDVYPIVSRQCGACHSPGGVAPMSLLTYDEARPWAESIRLELASGHMPPWFGDPGVAELKDPHRLSPRELDVVLTWVTGGTPRGPENAALAAGKVAVRAWRRGRPDVALPMPTAFSLPARQAEDTQEFVLETARDRDRFISAADLLPGNSAIVHDAIIFVRSASAPGQDSAKGATHERVLAAWVPGSVPMTAGPGVGFLWRVGEQLGVRIHYKKTWQLENKAAADRSTVGLYLLKTGGREVRTLDIPASGVVIEEDAQALAVVAIGGAGARTNPQARDVRDIVIEAVRPDGSRVPVIGFGARAGWDQRYWLASPLALPKGTRITANADAQVPASSPLRVAIDLVRSPS